MSQPAASQPVARSQPAARDRAPGRLIVDLVAGVMMAWFSVVAARVVERTMEFSSRGGAGPRHGPPVAAEPMIWPLLIPGIVLLAVAVLIRRRFPRLALLVVICGTGFYGAGAGPLLPIALSLILIGHSLGSRCPARRWLWPATLLVPAVALWQWDQPYWALDTAGPLLSLVICGAMLVIPAMIAILRNANREAARRHRAAELERVAAEERLRVAREVHDIVGHSLSVISLQAGVALRVIGSRPTEAEASLRAIRDSSAAALSELRQTLAVFRRVDAPPPVAPVADLSRIDELAAALRAAGRRVEIRREPDPLAPVPQHVAATAFRIVQESLTNVVRHTQGAAAVVTLRTPGSRLEVEITDDGPALARPLAFGGGLSGMAERVSIAGGSLLVEARLTGGVLVDAQLPFDDEAALRDGSR